VISKILFPAIDLKDGCPRCPQKLYFEDTQPDKGIRHV